METREVRWVRVVSLISTKTRKVYTKYNTEEFREMPRGRVSLTFDFRNVTRSSGRCQTEGTKETKVGNDNDKNGVSEGGWDQNIKGLVPDHRRTASRKRRRQRWRTLRKVPNEEVDRSDPSLLWRVTPIGTGMMIFDVLRWKIRNRNFYEGL